MPWRIVERNDRDQLGEGLCWSAREGALFWTDILGMSVHRLGLEDGNVKSWRLPEMVGWVIERAPHPGFIAGLQSGFVELDLEPFAIRRIANPHPQLPRNRLNDAKADAQGRIWAGSMDLAGDIPTGCLHRLNVDRTIETLDEGYLVANGPAFSIDGKRLYHTDSGRGLIYSFALNDNGSLGPRQVFVEFDDSWGKPDGMTVDAEGHVWVAHWGGGCVSRFDPLGKRAAIIELPTAQITNITFAGPKLDRLFASSAAIGQTHDPHAGGLFELEVVTTGVQTYLYLG